MILQISMGLFQCHTNKCNLQFQVVFIEPCWHCYIFDWFGSIFVDKGNWRLLLFTNFSICLWFYCLFFMFAVLLFTTGSSVMYFASETEWAIIFKDLFIFNLWTHWTLHRECSLITWSRQTPVVSYHPFISLVPSLPVYDISVWIITRKLLSPPWRIVSMP